MEIYCDVLVYVLQYNENGMYGSHSSQCQMSRWIFVSGDIQDKLTAQSPADGSGLQNVSG